MRASGSASIRSVVTAADHCATVLGAASTALYLQVGPSVLAVLTSDAVRLPCAVVLPTASTARSLRTLEPSGPVLVGQGRLAWATASAAIEIPVVRYWAPPTLPSLSGPDPARLRSLAAALGSGPDELIASALLGRGEGLTPSGDDILAGYLLAARCFDLDVTGLAGEIWTTAATRTTALSAALLRHAVAGECAPEVAAVLRGLAGAGSAPGWLRAVEALRAVGHSSGPALGQGIVAAARHSISRAGGLEPTAASA
jgi:hypothetical protein